MTASEIQQLCRSGGLPISAVRRRGDILVVVPESLEQLPGADQLARLADRLREQASCRYVTFAIDEPAQP